MDLKKQGPAVCIRFNQLMVESSGRNLYTSQRTSMIQTSVYYCYYSNDINCLAFAYVFCLCAVFSLLVLTLYLTSEQPSQYVNKQLNYAEILCVPYIHVWTYVLGCDFTRFVLQDLEKYSRQKAILGLVFPNIIEYALFSIFCLHKNAKIQRKGFSSQIFCQDRCLET